MKAGSLCERHKNVCISASLMAACKNPSGLLKKRGEEVLQNEADIHGRSGFPFKGEMKHRKFGETGNYKGIKKNFLKKVRGV